MHGIILWHTEPYPGILVCSSVHVQSSTKCYYATFLPFNLVPYSPSHLCRGAQPQCTTGTTLVWYCIQTYPSIHHIWFSGKPLLHSSISLLLVFYLQDSLAGCGQITYKILQGYGQKLFCIILIWDPVSRLEAALSLHPDNLYGTVRLLTGVCQAPFLQPCLLYQLQWMWGSEGFLHELSATDRCSLNPVGLGYLQIHKCGSNQIVTCTKDLQAQKCKAERDFKMSSILCPYSKTGKLYPGCPQVTLCYKAKISSPALADVKNNLEDQYCILKDMSFLSLPSKPKSPMYST